MGKHPDREFIKVFTGIRKNLKNKKWNCIEEDCCENAINSHLLQQNGILDKISDENHVIEISTADPYRWDQTKSLFQFNRTSVKKALSLKLFCQKHDSEIFKPIETEPLDLSIYSSQLLFTYRTLCAEKRKKEVVAQTHKRLLNSETLYGKIRVDEHQAMLDGTMEGIKDLDVYIGMIKQELKLPSNCFLFQVHHFPFIGVFGSAAFNFFETSETPYIERPLKYVFTHIIPQKDHLTIITGYHKDFVKPSIERYIESWKGLNKEQLGRELTDLFGSRIENWGMSPLVNQRIKGETRDRFINHFEDHAMLHFEGQRLDLDLFENEY